MKSRFIGLAVVVAVIVLTVGLVYTKQGMAVTPLSGYVGGEKIGFLEDEDVQKILAKKHYSIDYSKAGSLDMVTADPSGKDFLWPSSPTALEMYKAEVGKPVKSEVIFNTPIVIYTRRAVADALAIEGIVSETDGVTTVDLKQLIDLVSAGTSWESIGMPQLYGNVTISSTDPVKSNSGNMFAGLIANTLAGGVANENNINDYLPEIKAIFDQSGYMESSSADIFSEFLKMGMGAKPLVVGYESQFLEFSVENPDAFSQVKDDVVMMYPVPTVWSSHVFIALDDSAAQVTEALLDPEVQKIAWEKHGFRTGVSGGSADSSAFSDIGVAQNVTQVGQMPSYATMKKIIDYLQ